MTKHNLLINWVFIYIIIICLCIGLLLYFEAIRIKIAILLVGLVFSFIFYPIYILDKKHSERAIKEHKSKKSKEFLPNLNEQEKEKVEIIEQKSESIEEIIKAEGEDTDKKIEIYC